MIRYKAIRCGALLWVFVIHSSALLRGQQLERPRIRETNTHYELGDWISYSNTNYVNSIALGREYVYFATTGGIARYNFFTNKWDFPWTTSNGLASNYILAVAFDFSTSYLWCSTREGVSYYSPTQRIWRNIFKDEIGMSESEQVTSIGIGRNNIWLITDWGHSFKGDKQVGFFSPETLSPELADDKGEQEWFGQQGRKKIEFPLLFMSDGYLFDTRGYIQDFRLRRFNLSYYVRDPWNMLWVGTQGLGVAKADMRIDRLELLPFGLFKKQVKALARRGSDFWIGGLNLDAPLDVLEGQSAITHWNQNKDQWTYYQARYITGLTSDQVTSIALDDSCVWFGTQYGLARYHIEKNQWQTFDLFDQLSNNYINDVVVDDKYIFVATPSGIDKIIKASVATDSLEVQKIGGMGLVKVEVYDLELMRNLLWAGTIEGIYIYDTAKDTGGFYAGGPEGPFDETVTAVSVYENEIWFGTLGGVEAFDVKKKQWLGTPAKRFATGQPINSLKADKDVVWAGTNEGVLKFDRKRSFWRLFTVEDGLLDNVVHVILPDGDYVWFGTNEGLTRFYWNDPTRVD